MQIDFIIPITQQKKTAAGIETIDHGELEVSATVELPQTSEGIPDHDFLSVKYKGVDLLPLFDNMPEGGADCILDFISTKAIMEARERKLKS